MHVALVLLPVFGPLAVAASKLERGLEGDPAASTPASFGDRTALYERWPQIGSIPVNRTEGMLRGEKRQPKNLLEARQPDVSACFDLSLTLSHTSISPPSSGIEYRCARIQALFLCALSAIRIHAAPQESPFVRLLSSNKVMRSSPTGCHTAICCPTGTFCVGEKSCCDLRRVACGEGSSSITITPFATEEHAYQSPCAFLPPL